MFTQEDSASVDCYEKKGHKEQRQATVTGAVLALMALLIKVHKKNF